MKTFRAHTSFIPESVVNSSVRETPAVVLPRTDYEIIDTNQAFGIYIKIQTPKLANTHENIIQPIYISPKEIQSYGVVQNKLTIEEVRKILDGISFVKSCIDFDWGWEITEIEGDSFMEDKERNELENTTGYTKYGTIKGFLINTTFKRPDITTGVMGIGRGRRMWIEETASETSVVMTAWVCVELIVKHETMESFLFYNTKIFNPHKSLSELAYPEVIEKQNP